MNWNKSTLHQKERIGLDWIMSDFSITAFLPLGGRIPSQHKDLLSFFLPLFSYWILVKGIM